MSKRYDTKHKNDNYITDNYHKEYDQSAKTRNLTAPEQQKPRSGHRHEAFFLAKIFLKLNLLDVESEFHQTCLD